MDNIKKDNTEQKILEAAHAVFIKKGMDGARMQEIADEAGINKSLLHYYFRSKQKLFEAIFRKIFASAFPNISRLMLSHRPIEIKIGMFIDQYIDLLTNNPYLPNFILKEINRDPQSLAKAISQPELNSHEVLSSINKQGINPREIFQMFENEMKAGNIKKMNPADLMANILGLSIFPFAAKPLLTIMFFNGDKKAYNNFLKDRKKTVKEFVLNSIMINK